MLNFSDAIASADVCKGKILVKMIGVIGVSHKSASVKVREKLAIDSGDADVITRKLMDQGYFKELLILSTCNRTELYFNAEGICSGGTLKAVSTVLAEVKEIAEDTRPFLYQKVQNMAISHLFSVVAGLDSMILGEYQIVAQVKQAFKEAEARKSVGKVFHRMFNKALESSKQVRGQTPFNRGALSVSYAAVEKSLEYFPDLVNRNILIIGAGDTGELVLKNFAKKGCQNITITNRTEDKAFQLARPYKAKVLPFSEIMKGIHDAEIVVSSISCKEAFLNAANVLPSLNGHEHIVMIDLGVPRNIDDDVAAIPKVKLFNIDDLEEVIALNFSRKQEYVSIAEEIVSQKVEEFTVWLNEQNLAPAIKKIDERISKIYNTELELHKGSLTEEEYAALEKHSLHISKKLKNEFVKRLKEVTDNGSITDFVSVINLLFDEEKNEQPSAN